MPALNWGMINDGETFESLIGAILSEMQPSTIVFSLRGKDAGQDARSADGTVVYQAKYRKDLSMDGVIRLALDELKKIKKYRQPSSPNYVHWVNVKKWVLIANFQINPNIPLKWQSEVVPWFQESGMIAEYWSIEKLEAELFKHSTIRDVFFKEENRVLVSLDEAHDLLVDKCIGKTPFDIKFTGRDCELEIIKNFAASKEKRVLPIIGPGGIGKTRLLYEGLVALEKDGWRVLWALPASMSRSSQWFRLLNSTQQTCVAIDDPEDPGLLGAIIEQLASIERRKWKVIISARTEKAEALRSYRNLRHVHEPVELPPLDEPTSQELVNACLGGQAQPPWLHSVYGFTHGVPGWLCLIAELAKAGTLAELPASADEVAGIYLESCMAALHWPQPEQGLKLLRWLALWGRLRVDSNFVEQDEFRFLKKQGISEKDARGLLGQLTKTGLVRNWGIEQRLFSVEPLIIREHILATWLLRKEGDHYAVKDEGTALVKLMVDRGVPSEDTALWMLSHLTKSRLEQRKTFCLMEPFFKAMTTIVRDSNLQDQYRVSRLIVKAGATDPESALDVLTEIRCNRKDEMDLEAFIWGRQTLTHDALVAELPWFLFQIAECVSDQTVAYRFLNEFRELTKLELDGNLKAIPGEGPQELLKRLLSDLKNAKAYSHPAHEIAEKELTRPRSWPFVGLIIECLLDPIRKSADWVSKWTLTLTEVALTPDIEEWDLSASLRKKVFNSLDLNIDSAIRTSLWRVLAESHQAFHRAIHHQAVKGAINDKYRHVLQQDLENCSEILESLQNDISIEEATAARKMWEWYLEYGKDNALVGLAQKCEQVFSSLPISQWLFHDLFRFEWDQNRIPAINVVSEKLSNTKKIEEIESFFEGAMNYLKAARNGRKDGADLRRIFELAQACCERIDFNTDSLVKTISSFVKRVLEQQNADQENWLKWKFVVTICQHKLFLAKEKGGGKVSAELAGLLDIAADKSLLLLALYRNVYPEITGKLTRAELDCIIENKDWFLVQDYFTLLGTFCMIDVEGVLPILRSRLEDIQGEPVTASQCLKCFIRSLDHAALCYGWSGQQIPVGWIVEMISSFHLDGALLGGYEFKGLLERASYRLSMVQLSDLIRSRIDLESEPRPGKRFEILPNDLSITTWISFNRDDEKELDAFRALCLMTLKRSFTALYWIPRFVAQLDPTGEQTAAIVEEHLANASGIGDEKLARLGYLASRYSDDTDAWIRIAQPVCEKARILRREDREHVYSRLSNKEIVVHSRTPGQVSEHYVQQRDHASDLLASEPSSSPLYDYRKWALSCAEEELRLDRMQMEEDDEDD